MLLALFILFSINALVLHSAFCNVIGFALNTSVSYSVFLLNVDACFSYFFLVSYYCCDYSFIMIRIPYHHSVMYSLLLLVSELSS